MNNQDVAVKCVSIFCFRFFSGFSGLFKYINLVLSFSLQR